MNGPSHAVLRAEFLRNLIAQSQSELYTVTEIIKHEQRLARESHYRSTEPVQMPKPDAPHNEPSNTAADTLLRIMQNGDT